MRSIEASCSFGVIIEKVWLRKRRMRLWSTLLTVRMDKNKTTSPWESWGASDDGHTSLFRMIEKKPSSLGDMRATSVEWHSGRSLSQRDKGPL